MTSAKTNANASATHTPGPWRVKAADADYRAPDKDDYAIVAPDLICVGTVWQFGKTGEANARLIAAAPRLYDFVLACKQRGDAGAAALLGEINGNS
jgi:hypothetical protein